MWSMLFQACPGSVGAPRSAVYFFSERCSLKKKTELFFKKKGYKYLYGAVYPLVSYKSSSMSDDHRTSAITSSQALSPLPSTGDARITHEDVIVLACPRGCALRRRSAFLIIHRRKENGRRRDG